jgi:GT2 family glycosyltransferase
MGFMEKISVIIVNWNVGESFVRCIKSVLDTKYPNLELILIDNNSIKTPKIPKDPKVTYLQNKSNIGFPAAVNQGLKLFSGDYVLLLNPDTRIPNDFFDKAIESIELNKKTGIMGPKFVDPDGTPQGSVFPEPSVINTIREYWLGHKGLTEKYTPSNYEPIIVNAVSGACMFMPKAVVKKLGLFTDKIFMYYEDLDYCRRIRRAGLKVIFNPYLEIVHEHGQSSKQNILANKYLMDASRWYNGTLKHYILWFIIWTSQKLQKLKISI